MSDLISILGEQQVGIWDAGTGRLLKRLELPKELQNGGHLEELACTPDLSRIACGKMSPYFATAEAADAHAVVWNAHTGQVLQTFTLKNAIIVRSLAFSADGRRLATVGSQRGAHIRDVSSGELVLDFTPATGPRLGRGETLAFRHDEMAVA